MSPARALAQANAALVAGVKAPGMFVTAAYCLLDTEQGEVTVASAGHPPLLCRRVDGEVEAIERSGPALGVDPEAEFSQLRLQLQRGDRLLLFSDGALGADAAPDRVRECLAAGATVRETLDALRAGAESGVAVDDRDDVTAILLEARVGRSHFDDAICRPEQSRRELGTAPTEITVGKTPTTTWVRIAGRGTWTSAEPFHAFSHAALCAGRALSIDFSACEHLDSTFLGSIHEVVRAGRDGGVEVCLQGLSAPLRGLFEELSMRLVLDRVQETAAQLPVDLEPLARSAPSDSLTQERLLRAHETLASLSERNREEFRGVIESLRAELAVPAGSA
jgi:anti-anti-sigma regulatory factor